MTEQREAIHDFPTDLGDASEPAALGWTATLIALATVLLALTNAQSLSGWLAEFDPKPAVLTLSRTADGWEATTARIGLGAPRAELHAWWKQLEAARWSATLSSKTHSARQSGARDNLAETRQ